MGEEKRRKTIAHTRKLIEILESLKIIYKIIIINGTPLSKIEAFQCIKLYFKLKSKLSGK